MGMPNEIVWGIGMVILVIGAISASVLAMVSMRTNNAVLAHKTWSWTVALIVLVVVMGMIMSIVGVVQMLRYEGLSIGYGR